MNLDVTFRHLEHSDELRDLVERKATKVGRFLRDPVDAHVVLHEERHRSAVEVTMTGAGDNPFVAHGEAEDMRSAIDAAMHKVESAVRRAHDRRVDHRKGMHHGRSER